ncbi:MAG: alpha/beta fold hydrolase [Planctomycetia bacterium]|nr:alpha/beta fold hydrolase [Planctomycetia bacterium]
MTAAWNRCLHVPRLPWVLGLILVAATSHSVYGQEAKPADPAARARRQQSLIQLLSALPPSAHWNEWLQRSGELPPDFASMRRDIDLPDPLIAVEGDSRQPITTAADWQKHRAALRKHFEHWVTGRLPPPPGNVASEVLGQTQEGDVRVQRVGLRFGPEQRGTLNLQLLIPPGQGPFPVFISTLGNRSWAEVAVRRGYLGCLVAASDRQDDTEAFALLYPDFDFTCLARRAWGISRAIDYLVTLPLVRKDQLTLSDHSRGGKMATWAAAFDDRLTAVVGSSSVTGGSLPWRYCTDRYANETIEQITRNYPHWFHPRLRFFVGRENQLPIDMHQLVALIAPRAYMTTLGINESEVNPWGEERGYLAARRVYELLKVPDRLALRFRPGIHAPAAADLEAYFDWFDTMLGRRRFPLPDDLLYDYSFARWQKRSGDVLDPQKHPVRSLGDLLHDEEGRDIRQPLQWLEKRKQVRERLLAAMGEAPPRVRLPGAKNLTSSPPGSGPTRGSYVERIIGRPTATTEIDRTTLPFSSSLSGELFYRRGLPTGAKLPVVILLHPYAHARGYSLLPIVPTSSGTSAYQRGTFPLPDNGYLGTDFKVGTLVNEGFAVFAFDQIGFGSRIGEAKQFYERHPRWSLLGRMVADVHAAVDALTDNERVDARRIYVMGYSLGGTVALHAAALDDRIAGVAAISGFTPLRLENAEQGTGKLKDLAEIHGLLPRLGFFVNEPRRTPWDYHEVLGLIAPRPCLVVAPQHDQDANFTHVRTCVDEVRKLYELLQPEEKTRGGFEPDWSGQWRASVSSARRLRRLELYAPHEFNQLSNRQLVVAHHWLRLQLQAER